jgi:hypothetical protein
MARIDRERIERLRVTLEDEKAWSLDDLRECARDLLAAVDLLMANDPRFWNAARRERMQRVDATARALMASSSHYDPRGCYDRAAWLEREREAFIEREAQDAVDGVGRE